MKEIILVSASEANIFTGSMLEYKLAKPVVAVELSARFRKIVNERIVVVDSGTLNKYLVKKGKMRFNRKAFLNDWVKNGQPKRIKYSWLDKLKIRLRGLRWN